MSDQGNGPTSPINDISNLIDEDEDMYDVGDTDDTGDDGDTGTTDAGGDTGQPQQFVQDGGDTDPNLPLDLPQQQAPAPSQYDPDNPRGYARVGHLFADEKGNIVTRDGRVMAASGEAARHWSNMSRAAAESVTLRRQNEALTGQVERNAELIAAAKELADLPQKLGISREEYNAGIGIIQKFNQDPLAVCRDMVARTMARGFNATDILGKEAGNAIEMSALRTMLNEATAGQREREQSERIVAEQRRNAEVGYQQFITKYPDAHQHGDVIANLMRDKKISAVEAYHEIRYFAAQEGLDFNYPLGPQLANKERMLQQQRMPPPNRQTQRAPMVAGNGGGNRDHLTNDTQYADASASWGDILNTVMRQSA